MVGDLLAVKTMDYERRAPDRLPRVSFVH